MAKGLGKTNKGKGKGNGSTKPAAVASKKKVNKKPMHMSKKQLLNAYEIDEDEVQKNSRLHNLDDVEDIRYHVDEIASEDDEEIDSDEAYSDPEGITASLKIKSRNRKNKQKEEEEEDIDFDELEGEGFIDLSEMLEDVSETTKKENKLSVQKENVTLEELLLQPETDSELNSEIEQDYSDIEQEEEEEEVKDDKLISVINQLSNQKVKKYLKEQTETYKESEFNLNPNLNSQNDEPVKLSISDLLTNIEKEAKFDGLETKVSQLISKKSSGLLEAPLAKRLQDRVDRVAAYQHSKEFVTEWQPIVQANKEAEHINFNKVPQADAPANLGLKEKPTNDFEAGMDKLVSSSKLYEHQLQQKEELVMAKLTPQEVKKRQAELNKMRELMFRNEAKAKRASKIKSKTYRRLKKHDKEKLAKAERELLGEDDEEGEIFDAQVARAMERMTLKHKNTSKWAKNSLRHNDHTMNQTAMLEQLQEHERLTRKVSGIQSDRESESESEGGEDSHTTKAKAFDALDQLLGINVDDQEPTKGVMGMKFMKQAEKRKQAETDRLIQEAKEDLKLLDSDSDNGNQEEGDEDDVNVEGNPGRMMFQEKRKNKAKADENLHKLAGITQSSELSNKAKQATRITDSKATSKLIDDSNPWLLDGDDLAVKKKVKNLDAKRKDLAAKSVDKVKKAKKANGGNQLENQVELDLLNVLEANPEDEPQVMDLQPIEANVENPNAFTQSDLVQMAFADDDVVQAFAQEKAKVIEEQDHQVKDLSLPGWGSWAGETVKPKKMSKATKIKKNLLKISKQGIAAEKRKDKQLEHVIVNEIPNKRMFKYTLKEVPFPFKTLEQYEASLANPIGKEWNPGYTVNKQIKPKILKKKGKVIEPLTLKDH